MQVIYNIFDQSAGKNLFPLALDRSIGVLARVPLDEGALTGTITRASRFEPGDFREHYFQGDERKAEVEQHVAALRTDLAGVDGTLPEIALRFCLSHPAVTSVIPGMRQVRNVESNCGVSDRGALPAAALATLKKHAWDKDYYGPG